MPTYDYRCTKCGHRFELFHGIKDAARKRCPRCKSTARRVPAGGGGLLFKGTGFHITDYRSKSYQSDKARQEMGPSASGGDKAKGSPGSSGDKAKGPAASGGDKKPKSSSGE